jgi:class 3 adenylate cyclase
MDRPPAGRGAVRRYHGLQRAVRQRRRGVLDHAGDAVVAVFGAPHAHADDPERAVRAALGIQVAASRLADPRGGALRVHAGVCSGEVVAGPIISAAGAKYSVTGEPVNLAARICAVAPAGVTLVPESLRRLLAERGGRACVQGTKGAARPMGGGRRAAGRGGAAFRRARGRGGARPRRPARRH